MKKLILVLSLIAVSLSGCFIRAHDHHHHHRDDDHHDKGYYGDHDNRRDGRYHRY